MLQNNPLEVAGIEEDNNIILDPGRISHGIVDKKSCISWGSTEKSLQHKSFDLRAQQSHKHAVQKLYFIETTIIILYKNRK